MSKLIENTKAANVSEHQLVLPSANELTGSFNATVPLLLPTPPRGPKLALCMTYDSNQEENGGWCIDGLPNLVQDKESKKFYLDGELVNITEDRTSLEYNDKSGNILHFLKGKKTRHPILSIKDLHGNSIDFSYDKENRPLMIRYGKAQVIFSFAQGTGQIERISTIFDNKPQLHYGFIYQDQQPTLLGAINISGDSDSSEQREVSFTYNQENLLSAIDDPSGAAITIEYQNLKNTDRNTVTSYCTSVNSIVGIQEEEIECYFSQGSENSLYGYCFTQYAEKEVKANCGRFIKFHDTYLGKIQEEGTFSSETTTGTPSETMVKVGETCHYKVAGKINEYQELEDGSIGVSSSTKIQYLEKGEILTRDQKRFTYNSEGILCKIHDDEKTEFRKHKTIEHSKKVFTRKNPPSFYLLEESTLFAGKHDEEPNEKYSSKQLLKQRRYEYRCSKDAGLSAFDEIITSDWVSNKIIYDKNDKIKSVTPQYSRELQKMVSGSTVLICSDLDEKLNPKKQKTEITLDEYGFPQKFTYTGTKGSQFSEEAKVDPVLGEQLSFTDKQKKTTVSEFNIFGELIKTISGNGGITERSIIKETRKYEVGENDNKKTEIRDLIYREITSTEKQTSAITREYTGLHGDTVLTANQVKDDMWKMVAEEHLLKEKISQQSMLFIGNPDQLNNLDLKWKENIKWSKEYMDVLGRIAKEEIPEQGTTAYEYSAIKQDDQLNSVLQTKVNLTLSGENESKHITTQRFDKHGRITADKGWNSTTTIFQYDSMGRIIRKQRGVKGGEKSREKYFYDGLDRVIATDDTLKGIRKKVFDIGSDLLLGEDVNGKKITYQYGEWNEPIKKTVNGSSYKIGWENTNSNAKNFGKPISLELPNKLKFTFEYDEAGNEASNTLTLPDDKSFKITTAYKDNQKVVTYPTDSKTQVITDYSDSGWIDQVSLKHGNDNKAKTIANYLERSGEGIATKVLFGNDIAEHNFLDKFGRVNRKVIGIANKKTQKNKKGVPSYLDERRQFTKTMPGLTEKLNTLGTDASYTEQNYGYDNTGQLTSWGTNSKQTLSFTYDKNRRTTKVGKTEFKAKTSNENKEIPYQVATCYYDANGNIIRLPESGSDKAFIDTGFDIENLLRIITAGSDTTCCEYDLDGNMVMRQDPDGALTIRMSEDFQINISADGKLVSTTVNIQGDNGTIATCTEEYSGKIDKDKLSFTYSPQKTKLNKKAMKDFSKALGFKGGDGRPTMAKDQKVIRYLHKNQVGSTTLVTDSKGGLTAQIGYTPYGEIDPNATSGLHDVTLEYAHQPMLGATGLYINHNASRPYAPWLTLFLTPDKTDLSVNPYGYAENNPVSFYDDGNCGQSGNRTSYWSRFKGMVNFVCDKLNQMNNWLLEQSVCGHKEMFGFGWKANRALRWGTELAAATFVFSGWAGTKDCIVTPAKTSFKRLRCAAPFIAFLGCFGGIFLIIELLVQYKKISAKTNAWLPWVVSPITGGVLNMIWAMIFSYLGLGKGPGSNTNESYGLEFAIGSIAGLLSCIPGTIFGQLKKLQKWASKSITRRVITETVLLAFIFFFYSCGDQIGRSTMRQNGWNTKNAMNIEAGVIFVSGTTLPLSWVYYFMPFKIFCCLMGREKIKNSRGEDTNENLPLFHIPEQALMLQSSSTAPNVNRNVNDTSNIANDELKSDNEDNVDGSELVQLKPNVIVPNQNTVITVDTTDKILEEALNEFENNEETTLLVNTNNPNININISNSGNTKVVTNINLVTNPDISNNKPAPIEVVELENIDDDEKSN